MLTTLMPALIACLTVVMSWGPKIGCTMIALYCFDVHERLQLRELLLRVVGRVEDACTGALFALATFLAAASIGAS